MFKKILFTIFALVLISAPISSFAADGDGGSGMPGESKADELLPREKENLKNLTDSNFLRDVVPSAIKIILLLAAFFAFASMVYSGIRMVVSADKPEELENAKKNFVYSIIGVTIAGAAYSIVYGVLQLFS